MALTLELKESQQKLLDELAAESGVPSSEFALTTLMSTLEQEKAVRQAGRYVMNKNRELYERLAK